MMKLRIATGLGLVLLMATMVGGPVGVTHAQDDEGGVTLADLAGKFASRGGGFFTLCVSSGALISCSSVSPVPTPVPFNDTAVSYFTRDAAGNICGVSISTAAPVFGTKGPAAVATRTNVGTPISFDPTTGSGTVSTKQYHGGSCNGAVFNSAGATLVATFTVSFEVSDSGNRIEQIVTDYSAVTSAFSVAGSVQGQVFSNTAIRQHKHD